MRLRRRVSELAVAVAIALVAAACTSGSPGSRDATASVAGASGGRSPSADPPPVGGVLADRMELVGNLPGSDGSFAFWGDLAVVNQWAESGRPSLGDGFIVADISDPTRPRELSRFRCIASHNDISIWKDLVFLSQNRATAGDGCDATKTNPQSPKAFAGVRVVSIADPEHPVAVAAVPTGIARTGSGLYVRGSHTHTIVPDLDHTDASGQPAPRLIVYSADGYQQGVKPSATIVEVPLRDPASAHVIGTIDNGTDLECHDMTVFMPRELMACGAHDAGVILFDIHDPAHPVQLSSFVNLSVSNHHSTAFSNDGNTLVLDDEVYTGICAGGTDEASGVLWFYDVSDPRAPEELGYFQIPRPDDEHFCYAHESNVIPMRGQRDIVVTGWMGGGVNLVDFTDPSRPTEIAYWVDTALDGDHSFAYAGYWYNGHVYAANTAITDLDDPVTDRGFDVFAVDLPMLSKAEDLTHMNAQTQEDWPIRRS